MELIKRYWSDALGAVVVLLTRLWSLPRSPWELDEFHFMAGVLDFDPSKYHPHPPGYPLFIAMGKAVQAWTHDPFKALVTVSVISCVIGFLALTSAFRNYTSDRDVAAGAALLFYLSAGMLVHSPLALTDGATLMFLSLAFAAMSHFPDAGSERRAMLAGLWCAAAIGVRPQICIPLLPAFAAGLWLMRGTSDATSPKLKRPLIALITFTLVCLAWFLPLMDAAGGPAALKAYEMKQAQYFAEHDAALSRGALGFGPIATRFIAHPWGSKYLVLPLLIAAAAGAVRFLRSFRRASWPLIVFCSVHLLFALAAMDPTDGVRYALPSMTIIALVAGIGVAWGGRIVQIPYAALIFALLMGAGSWMYVSPIIRQRTTTLSPVAAAAAWANTHYDERTVIAFDLALREQAALLMPRFRALPIDQALSKYYDEPGTPLVLFADGSSRLKEAKVFAWPMSDAFGKLTRNKYREVTLDPVRPVERYLPVRGMYAMERTNDGEEWRWLARNAAFRLPATHPASVTLRFQLSRDAPYVTNEVSILVNGQEAATATARRNDITAVPVSLPPAPVEITIVSAESFVPAAALHNQDRRELAVELVGIEN